MAKTGLMSIEDFKARVFHVLEAGSAHSPISRTVDILLAMLIVLNVASTILETEGDLAVRYANEFAIFELVSVIIFTTEFVLRVWSCTAEPHLQKLGALQGRLVFMSRPFAIIDLLAILPFYLSTFFGVDLRMLRLFRLVRFLKLARYSSALSTLMHVIAREKDSLIAAFLVMMGVLLMSASIMHYLENEAQPEAFGSISSSLWWALATLTTVGYGDVVPVTYAGRAFAGVVMIFGLAMFAVPIGILGTGFQEEIQRRKAVVTWGMVAKVPVLAHLSAAQVAEVMSRMLTRKIRQGEVLSTSSGPSEEMFFIASGDVELRCEGHEEAVILHEGAFFGEDALLSLDNAAEHEPEPATAIATSDCVVLILERAELRELAWKLPEMFSLVRRSLTEQGRRTF